MQHAVNFSKNALSNATSSLAAPPGDAIVDKLPIWQSDGCKVARFTGRRLVSRSARP